MTWREEYPWHVDIDLSVDWTVARPTAARCRWPCCRCTVACQSWTAAQSPATQTLRRRRAAALLSVTPQLSRLLDSHFITSVLLHRLTELRFYVPLDTIQTGSSNPISWLVHRENQFFHIPKHLNGKIPDNSCSGIICSSNAHKTASTACCFNSTLRALKF